MNKLILLVVLVVLAGCGTQDETPARTNGYEPVLNNREDSLEHDVLEGHDQAMARIAKLSKSSKRVQQLIDSLANIPVSRKDQSLEQQLNSIQKELAEAHQSMNEWMDGFKLDSLKGQKDARVLYLEAELLKVNSMKNKMLMALEKSDSLLNKK